MHKIIVFDLDGTLAPANHRMTGTTYEHLLKLDAQGYTIALCSGKPLYYLAGFARQMDPVVPILIGENGAAFQRGIATPPADFTIHPYTERAREQLDCLKERIDRTCGDKVWYQPNLVALTPFPLEPSVFEEIQTLIDALEDTLTDVTVYRHWDCYDILPNTISKSSALHLLAAREGLSPADFIAVGDGINDVPMFEYADISIGIGDKLPYEPTYRFATIEEATAFLCEQQL